MTESIQTTANTAAAKDLRAVYAAPTLTELCLQETAAGLPPYIDGIINGTPSQL